MRWTATLALALFFYCVPSWSEPSSAQGSSSSSTGQPPEGSAGDSQPPSASWERFDDLLNRLERSAADSSEESRLLKLSLEDARSRLTELLTRLDESGTRAAALSSSLESCERSLAASEASLREAQAQAGRVEAQLRLWRWTAGIGAAAGLAGLAWGLASSLR